MQDYLKQLPEELRGLINLASDTASRNNFPAYLVGGFVRDLILRVKNFDIDIVVECNGIKFAEDLCALLKAKLIAHRRFGTATVMLSPNLKIDVATVRKEFYPQAACLPHVTSGTLEDDLRRRDFTINAMGISIDKKDFGALIDFFNGKSDLRGEKIRVLHDLSFIDDPTRILRGVRFEKRYNFRIEPQTLKYLKEAVRLDMLEKVQPQRVRDELILLLKEKDPIKPLKRIQKLAGFGFISPRLKASGETYRLLNSIRSQIGWFRRKLSRHRQIDAWLVYFMGLLDSLNSAGIKSVCKKFALPKGEEKRILSSKKLSRKFIRELIRDKVKPSKIFRMLQPLSYETLLLLKAKYKNRNIRKHIEDFLINYNTVRIHISGHDLRNLGINPGPAYQKIFREILDARLDGLVKTKEEELALIKKCS